MDKPGARPSTPSSGPEGRDRKEKFYFAMPKKGKNSKAALAESLTAGTKKHFATAASLAFDSATFTPAQIETEFQRLIDLRAGVEAAQAAAATKVAAEVNQAPAILGLMTAYVAFVRNTFAKSPDVLADFGLKPKKARAPMTAVAKAAAAAKRKSTRTARKTMGSQQRKTVTGTVTGVVVTPVDAAAPPVVTASPATSGGSSTHGA